MSGTIVLRNFSWGCAIRYPVESHLNIREGVFFLRSSLQDDSYVEYSFLDLYINKEELH